MPLLYCILPTKVCPGYSTADVCAWCRTAAKLLSAGLNSLLQTGDTKSIHGQVRAREQHHTRKRMPYTMRCTQDKDSNSCHNLSTYRRNDDNIHVVPSLQDEVDQLTCVMPRCSRVDKSRLVKHLNALLVFRNTSSCWIRMSDPFLGVSGAPPAVITEQRKLAETLTLSCE